MKLSHALTTRNVLIVGLFGVCPFLFSHHLNDTARYPQLLGLMVVIILVLGLSWIEKGEKERVAVPVWLLGLLAVWLGLHLVSLSQAVNLQEGIFETLRAGIMAGLLMVLLRFFRENDTWDVLARIVVVGGAVQAVVALLQAQGVDPLGTLFGEMPTGTHVNPNQLGSALLMMLPLVLWAVLRLGTGWKIAGAVALTLMLVAMFLSGSRAVWLALLTWAMIVPLWVLPMLWRRPGLRRWFWAGMALGAGLIALGWFAFRKVGVKKMASHRYEYMWQPDVMIRREHNSLENRYIVWNRSMDMIADHPLTGVGAGNWKVVIPRYGIKGFDDEGHYGMDFFMRPHNDFLGVGAELGVAGLLCLLAFFGIGHVAGIRLAGKGRDPAEREKGFLILLAFTGMAVVAFFSFPFERSFQSMMFWTWLALAILALPGTGSGRVVKAGGRSLFAGVAVVMIGGLVVTGFRVRGDAAFREIIAAKAAKNWQLTESLAEEAPNWAITIESVSGAPAEWYAGLAQLSMGKHQEGLASMEAAREIAPWHLAVRTNLAAAYELSGKHARAASEYEDLLATFPDFEDSRLNLAVVYLHLGDYPKARKALGMVKELQTDPRYLGVRSELDRLNH